MRQFFSATLYLALLCTAPFGAAQASDGYAANLAQQTPLMIIRFNQPHVAYATPLYTVLEKALQVKPTVRFDIVSVAPLSKDLASQARNNEIAAHYAESVMMTLKEIGMPPERVNLINTTENVDTSEVRVYAH